LRVNNDANDYANDDLNDYAGASDDANDK